MSLENYLVPMYHKRIKKRSKGRYSNRYRPKKAELEQFLGDALPDPQLKELYKSYKRLGEKQTISIEELEILYRALLYDTVPVISFFSRRKKDQNALIKIQHIYYLCKSGQRYDGQNLGKISIPWAERKLPLQEKLKDRTC